MKTICKHLFVLTFVIILLFVYSLFSGRKYFSVFGISYNCRNPLLIMIALGIQLFYINLFM